MSAFSEYAARSEWNTSINARTPVADLQDWAADHPTTMRRATPVSGDMLAVLKHGTPTQRRRRRARARNNW